MNHDNPLLHDWITTSNELKYDWCIFQIHPLRFMKFMKFMKCIKFMKLKYEIYGQSNASWRNPEPQVAPLITKCTDLFPFLIRAPRP